MLGGTDCTEVDIPEDVVVSDCHLRKPTEWRGWTGAKNLFEVKNAKKVTLERSLLEYSWVEGQIGFAILLNVRNQEGTALIVAPGRIDAFNHVVFNRDARSLLCSGVAGLSCCRHNGILERSGDAGVDARHRSQARQNLRLYASRSHPDPRDSL